MVAYGGAELWDRLLEMREIWKEKRVVRDWKDAEIIPISKKGNLQLCDNWRGIIVRVLGRTHVHIRTMSSKAGGG